MAFTKFLFVLATRAS